MNINDSHSIARFMPNRSVQQTNALQHRRTVGQSQVPDRPQAANMAKALLDAKQTAATAPTAAKTPSTAQSMHHGQPEVQHSSPSPLEALIADWGQKDSPYDLNGDGTVGIQDMLQLLAEMSFKKDDPPVIDQPKLDISDKPRGVEHDKPDLNPLDALIADWGKKDSPHDLNGDGTVGIQDMLLLLKRMAEDTFGGPPPVADPDTGVTPPPLTPGDVANPGGQPDALQALLDDWGKKDSPYDLNGDGTVGIQDMLELLKRMTDSPNPPPGIDLDAADTTGPGSVNDSGADLTPAKTPLELLIEDWGKTGSRWDLNHDGNVGIRDMLLLLKRMTDIQPSSSGAQRLDHEGRGHGHRTSRVAANYHRVAAQNFARAMAPQFSGMQPGELRESIRGSNLPEPQKRFVLDQIAALHPHGHNISLVG